AGASPVHDDASLDALGCEGAAPARHPPRAARRRRPPGGAAARLVEGAGGAAARHRPGRAVRPAARDGAPHRLRQSPAERPGRLAGRGALAVQLALLPAIPPGPSPPHPGPRAGPGADAAAPHPPARLHREDARHPLLAGPGAEPLGRAARRPLCLFLHQSGDGAPRHPQHAGDGRGGARPRPALRPRLRVAGAPSLLDPAAARRPAPAAPLPLHRAHRLLDGPQRADQHPHHADDAADAPADVEHALPRRAPPLPLHPLPSPGRGACRAARPPRPCASRLCQLACRAPEDAARM
ncbi:MAG: Probable hydrocarbon oxygenase MocD, partial [uncultured Craurococcus sp.]